jgi:hypothetical protein
VSSARTPIQAADNAFAWWEYIRDAAQRVRQQSRSARDAGVSVSVKNNIMLCLRHK